MVLEVKDKLDIELLTQKNTKSDTKEDGREQRKMLFALLFFCFAVICVNGFLSIPTLMTMYRKTRNITSTVPHTVR